MHLRSTQGPPPPLEGRRILFLNSNAAKKGRLGEVHFDPAYVLLARFFGCGPIDRTETLEPGFSYRVLDPIPKLPAASAPKPSFAEICDAVANDLLDEALGAATQLQVLWSGGIDSTVALAALLRACETRGISTDVLEIALSMASISEFPAFYHQHIEDRLKTVAVAPPLSDQVDPAKRIVTGEHGDQLFGSMHSKEMVENGSAWRPYGEVMPLLMAQKLGSVDKAETLLSYLEPQIARCPIPIETAFDFMWWINFSIKWQQVTLRLAVFRGTEIQETHESTRHFFRDRRFQEWSLAHPDLRIRNTWESYKWVAKEYIHAFLPDADYLETKIKEPSLRSVLVNRKKRRGRRVRAVVYEDWTPHFKVFRRKPKEGKKTMQDSTTPSGDPAFSHFDFQHGVLWDAAENPFPTVLSAWTEEEPLQVDVERHGAGDATRNSTLFGFIAEGPTTVTARHGSYQLATGQYFCFHEITEISGGRGIVIERLGYRGLNMVGGPVEERGRLRYIDGCTDTLLVPPVKLGDACLNALFFPPGIDQTQHTHPSMRVGLIASGNGICVTPKGEIPLVPGMIFVIHEEGLHKFRTGHEESMVVIAYHPDSDFGPQDEDHPMINRTIVEGVSAAKIDAIRTAG